MRTLIWKKNEATEKQNKLILELIGEKELKAEDVELTSVSIHCFPWTFGKLCQKILTFTQIL